MIPTDIRDYVKVYKKFLSKALCEDLINDLKKANWKEHYFYNTKEGLTQYDHEFEVTQINTDSQQILHKMIWRVIQKYILKDFQEFDSWWNGWNGYTNIRFNKYDVTTQMEEHCDHIHSMFDGNIKGIPTLSIVGCLNDDYKGGDFIMWQTEKIEIPSGSIMVFPSNFMYPHKVTSITEGVRYSFVSWVY